MITAEWLLTNHQKHSSFAKMLEVQIQHIVDTPIQATDVDGFIEDLALGGKPLDGLPHVIRRDSKTEEIATTYRDRMEAEQARNVQTLQQQLHQMRYYILLYDAVIAGLDPAEKWIVESHYLQSLSLNEMVRIAPDTLINVSKSTLYRKKNELLTKIDHYLQIVQAPVDKESVKIWRPVRTAQAPKLKEMNHPGLPDRQGISQKA